MRVGGDVWAEVRCEEPREGEGDEGAEGVVQQGWDEEVRVEVDPSQAAFGV